MKAGILTGSLLAVLILAPTRAASRAPQPVPQQKAAPAAKNADARPASAKEELPNPEVPRISAEEVKRMIEQKAKMVVVDTRDGLTYEDGHLQGAVNIYYDPTVDPRDREMTLIALPKDKLIVIYCECNNEEDSIPMALELWQLGYDRDKVKALRGGSIRWRELKYPFVSTPTDASSEKAK